MNPYETIRTRGAQLNSHELAPDEREKAMSEYWTAIKEVEATAENTKRELRKFLREHTTPPDKFLAMPSLDEVRISTARYQGVRYPNGRFYRETIVLIAQDEAMLEIGLEDMVAAAADNTSYGGI